MLLVRDVYRSFGLRKILEGVTFSLKDASFTGLIGPSGGGKSVLLKIIAQTCRSEHGSVSIGSCEIQDIALMFQEGALFDSLSVYDNVAFPLVGGRVPTNSLCRIEREAVCDKVSEILARVGLLKAAYKLPGQISGGMRRRTSLARALVSKPKVLLLDDPTSGLDPVASSVIMDLISELHREYRPTTLVVSHDLRRLLPCVERVLALFHGRIVFDGTLDELKKHAARDVRSFVECRFELDEQPQRAH